MTERCTTPPHHTVPVGFVRVALLKLLPLNLYQICAISLDGNTQYHNYTMSNPSYYGIPSCRRSQRWTITWIMLLSLQALLPQAVHVAPRHCRGGVRHLHLSVGKDPSTQMTISFASAWSDPGVEAPIAGVHIGTAPNHLDRFVGEQEFPVTYVSGLLGKTGHHYYSPFQHHITIDNLEPNTTYYYIAVLGDRSLGIDHLRDLPLRDHPSQHQNLDAENKVMSAQQQISRDNDEGSLRRRLAPPPYDGHEKPCVEGFQVRSFTTAPRPGSEAAKSATFAIIGDLGQFDHSKETLAHMKTNRAGIDAVVLVGDIAYTEYDHRRWDTFFDFLDDYSIFDEVPLQVAIGNHGTCSTFSSEESHLPLRMSHCSLINCFQISTSKRMATNFFKPTKLVFACPKSIHQKLEFSMDQRGS